MVKQENSTSFDYKELYEYNLQGNLVEKTVYDNPQWDPLYHWYTYDTAGMLTSESYGMLYFEYWKNSYSYDNRGNRTSNVSATIEDYENGFKMPYKAFNDLINP